MCAINTLSFMNSEILQHSVRTGRDSDHGISDILEEKSIIWDKVHERIYLDLVVKRLKSFTIEIT